MIKNIQAAALVVWLMTIPFPSKNLSAPQEKESIDELRASTLKFRLLAPEPSVCRQSSLDLEIEMRNDGKDDVLILPAGLSYQITVFRNLDSIESLNEGGITKEYKKYELLHPGQSYRTVLRYALNGKFFDEMGLYKIQMRYGQFSHPTKEFPKLFRGFADSNVVLFEVKGCHDN